VLLETGICSDFCVEDPFESKADTMKLNVPAELGVPEIVPELLASETPFGNSPETIAKV
jgi:hypothetical protein